MNEIFDKSSTKTISHKLKLLVRIHSDALTLRQPIRVSISVDQARKFMESYNKFEQTMRVTKDNQPVAWPPGATLTHLMEQYPWKQFIEILGLGAVEAVMAMVEKKSDGISDLPANKNNVLGIAFEKFQIALLRAEIVRKGSPIELIAGDGFGKFQHNGVEMQTPEYTDAVLHNTATDQYFAVQFKFTDDPRGLVRLVEDWNSKWLGKTPDSTLPEALLPKNVVMIGPNGVAGERIAHQFKQNEQIRYTPDGVKVMYMFLDDNSALLQDIVNSEEFQRNKGFKEEAKRMKKTLDKKGRELTAHEQNLKSLKELKEFNVTLGENTNRIDEGISAMGNQITELKTNISQTKSQYDIEENNLQISDKRIRSQIEKGINTKYREPYIKKAAMKEMALNVFVGAAVDGSTSLICTAGDEYGRYKKGEITIKQFTGTVLKSTAIATAKGATFGLGLSSFNLAAQYAVAKGSVYAGALTTVAKAAVLVLMVGTFLKQSYDNITAWNNGDLTTAGMKKAFARTVTSGSLSIAGMTGAGALIGGPLGLFVGAGFAFAIGVGDGFLGDKIWSLVFEENEEEQTALKQKNEKIRTEVISLAYTLLGLSEYATLAEVKVSYKTAILKYHPDKGGDTEIFNAVILANRLICSIDDNSV